MRHLTDKKRAGALLATTVAILLSGTLLLGPIGRGPDTAQAAQAVRAAGRDEAISPSYRGDRPADALPTSTPAVATPAATPAPPAPAPMPPIPLSRYKLKKPAPQIRVGIQAGHWKPWEAPDEISFFRNSVGAHQDDWSEATINLDISRRVAELLKAQGIQVDLLPVTVSEGYRADAFVSIHGDANNDPKLSGFKAARSVWSKIPAQDDALLGAINSEYWLGTRLKEHRSTITDNMTMYYAFNNRKFKNSVDPSTPAVILETGFLTNDGDRRLIQSQPDRLAESIARGILRFLSNQ